MQGLFTEHLQTHAQLRTDGVRPMDDGSTPKSPPPKKSVEPRFNPGNHSTLRFPPHPSNLHLEMAVSFLMAMLSTPLFSPFFYMKEIRLIKMCLRVRYVTRARPSAREKSDGRSCQRHDLLAGTQQSLTLLTMLFPDHVQWLKMPTRGSHHRCRARHHTAMMRIIIWTRPEGPELHHIIRMAPQRFLHD